MESHLPDCYIFNECPAFGILLECLKWSVMLILCKKNTCISFTDLLTGCISTTGNILLEGGEGKPMNPVELNFGVG